MEDREGERQGLNHRLPPLDNGAGGEVEHVAALTAGGFATGQGDGHQHVVGVHIEVGDQRVIATSLLPELAQLEVLTPETGGE